MTYYEAFSYFYCPEEGTHSRNELMLWFQVHVCPRWSWSYHPLILILYRGVGTSWAFFTDELCWNLKQLDLILPCHIAKLLPNSVNGWMKFKLTVQATESILRRKMSAKKLTGSLCLTRAWQHCPIIWPGPLRKETYFLQSGQKVLEKQTFAVGSCLSVCVHSPLPCLRYICIIKTTKVRKCFI